MSLYDSPDTCRTIAFADQSEGKLVEVAYVSKLQLTEVTGEISDPIAGASYGCITTETHQKEENESVDFSADSSTVTETGISGYSPAIIKAGSLAKYNIQARYAS
jgi:hypothetical protein